MDPSFGRVLRRILRVAVPACLAAPGLIATRPACAASIRVPDDQPTLQAAVRVAADGDVIVIAPGTWTGGAFVDHKRLGFQSWYAGTGDTSYISRTVLSGVASNVCGGAPGCAGNAVLEFGADAHDSQIFGLTLTQGENGVASSSKVGLTACHVIANGDGVDFVAGSGGTFSNSLFAGNTDDGIDLNGDMDLTVTHCTIRDNGDDGIEYRVYDYLGPVRTLTVDHCRISGNAEDGIQLIDYSGHSDCVIRIERNLFTSNFDASGSSAAIGCMANGNTVENLGGAAMAERVFVNHNTFMAERNGLVGGANTIALNNVFAGISGSALRRVAGGSITAYSLFWDNGIHYESSVIDTGTVRVADPRLDAGGRLTLGSPAIDAGTHAFSWGGQVVLDEPLNYPSDLGAFEYLPNRPPVVRLGRDRVVRLPALVRLSGAVSDDGQPVPEGMLSFEWSVLSGPAPVALDTPTAPSTGASFAVPGRYVVRLAAFDGDLTGADTMQVAVLEMIGIGDFPVCARADDAEEEVSGALSSNVSDLELVYRGGNQVVGLRFPGVTVAPGSVVSRAYVQFVADGVQSEPTTLLVQGQAADDPDTFAVRMHEISSRPRTAASATWEVPPWTEVGAAGSGERSADLSAVIQEIVDRPGWTVGNAMVLIITGSGHRTAASYDGDPARGAILHIEAEPPVIGAEAPPVVTLELRPAGRVPARGAVEVELALPSGRPATLELLDLAGRRIVARPVGTLGAGRHRVELARDLRAGVFFVRLSQDGRSRVIKAPVLR